MAMGLFVVLPWARPRALPAPELLPFGLGRSCVGFNRGLTGSEAPDREMTLRRRGRAAGSSSCSRVFLRGGFIFQAGPASFECGTRCSGSSLYRLRARFALEEAAGRVHP